MLPTINQQPSGFPCEVISQFFNEETELTTFLGFSRVCQHWDRALINNIKDICKDNRFIFLPQDDSKVISTFARIIGQRQCIALETSIFMDEKTDNQTIEETSIFEKCLATIEKLLCRLQLQMRFSGLDCFIFATYTFGVHFKGNGDVYEISTRYTKEITFESENHINSTTDKIINYFKSSRTFYGVKDTALFYPLFGKIESRAKQISKLPVRNYHVYFLSAFNNFFLFPDFEALGQSFKTTLIKTCESEHLDIFEKRYKAWKKAQEIAYNKPHAKGEEFSFEIVLCSDLEKELS